MRNVSASLGNANPILSSYCAERPFWRFSSVVCLGEQDEPAWSFEINTLCRLRRSAEYRPENIAHSPAASIRVLPAKVVSKGATTKMTGVDVPTIKPGRPRRQVFCSSGQGPNEQHR